MTDQERETMTHAERQREYHRRRREAGLVRVSAWIPKGGRAAFWEAYDQLVEGWKRRGQWPDS